MIINNIEKYTNDDYYVLELVGEGVYSIMRAIKFSIRFREEFCLFESESLKNYACNKDIFNQGGIIVFATNNEFLNLNNDIVIDFVKNVIEKVEKKLSEELKPLKFRVGNFFRTAYSSSKGKNIIDKNSLSIEFLGFDNDDIFFKVLMLLCKELKAVSCFVKSYNSNSLFLIDDYTEKSYYK